MFGWLNDLLKWAKSFFSEGAEGKGSYGRLCGFLGLLMTLRIADRAASKSEGIPDGLEALAVFFLMISGPYLGGKVTDLLKSKK